MTAGARRGSARPVLLSLVLVLLSIRPSRAAGVDAPLASALASAGPNDELPIIVRLADRVDTRAFAEGDRRLRRRELVTALRRKADLTHGPVRALLRRRRASLVAPLWIMNGLAIRARPDVIRELAALPGIAAVTLDATLGIPEVTPAAAAPPEWNLTAIGAPVLWDLGYTGAGIVLASMDTGVDLGHPDVGPKWRGGTNSWFDPHGQHPSPADADGHGTQTMGLLVGGAAGGTAIGVAPGARWIGVKIFNDAGTASLSAIHLGFQWLLDPDGNASTDDAPDVVNNSWGLTQSVGGCDPEFEPDVQVLQAAGIAIVFAAGNAGPGSGTSLSPANYAGGVAIGAVSASGALASFSSRGPSACDGDLFPDVVAPGVSVKTADLTFGGAFPDSYVHTSGTSFAAPHVAGGMALLLEAHPSRSASELALAIRESALDGGASGPDDQYGYGRVDLPAAHDWLATRTVTEVRVSASDDDAEEQASGSVSLLSSRLELVRDIDDQTVGLRFAGLAIPPGATITRAWVQFRASEVTSEPTALTISGEAAGNAPPFHASALDVSSRARTAATVAWPDVAPWPIAGAAAVAQQTPDIAAIVQEVVDRGDWTAGSALAIIVQGTGRRVAESYDGLPGGAPLLHVEYVPPPPPTTTTSTSTTTTTESTSTTASTTTTESTPTTTSTTTTESTTTTTSTTTTESTTTTTPTTTTSTTTSSTTTTMPPTPQTLSIPVSTGSDDAEESASGSVQNSSGDLELVRDSSNQKVGMRFRNVTIPPGATIDHAWVQFQVDETASEATNLTITGQNVGNAPAFTTSANNISARTRTVAVSWPSVPAWPTVGARGAAQQTTDIAGILQQLVNRGDWASGNAVVIIVEGTGKRVAESYEGSVAGAPTLHVESHTGGGATTTTTTTLALPTTTTAGPTTTTTTTLPPTAQTRDIPVSTRGDDAEQSASGSVNLESGDLELIRDSSDQTVGMRFRNVTIPPGATIDLAYIQFQVDETSSETTNLTITGQDVGNAPAFGTNSNNISSRLRTVSVSWPNVPAWPTVGARGTAQRTTDIKAILQQLVTRGDWGSGNAMVIIIQGTGKRVAESYDGSQSGAPTLHVEFHLG